MADPVTSNKGLAVPTRGSDSGTWDLPLNGNAQTLDALLGSTLALTITNVDLTLSQTQANNLAFNVTGALTGNRNIFFPPIGAMFFITNNTTGAFTLTVTTTATGAQGIVIPQGFSQLVYLDGTSAHPAAPSPSVIPSGTVMLFFQAAAPVGWTQVTSENDYALRIVSGTGGALTGNVGLSAFIATGALGHALTINEMPSHAHGVNDPGHSHTYQHASFSAHYPTNSFVNAASGQFTDNTGGSATGISIQNAGSNAPHTHGLPNLQYADIIVCTKN